MVNVSNAAEYVALATIQGAIVALPHPAALERLGRLRSPAWGLVAPGSILVGTFGVLALPLVARGLAVLARMATPVLAAIAVLAVVHGRQRRLLLVPVALGVIAAGARWMARRARGQPAHRARVPDAGRGPGPPDAGSLAVPWRARHGRRGCAAARRRRGPAGRRAAARRPGEHHPADARSRRTGAVHPGLSRPGACPRAGRHRRRACRATASGGARRDLGGGVWRALHVRRRAARDRSR